MTASLNLRGGTYRVFVVCPKNGVSPVDVGS